jgi:hypothetical protein
MLRLRNENFHPRATRGGNSWGDDQKRDSDVQGFAWLSQIAPALLPHSSD